MRRRLTGIGRWHGIAQCAFDPAVSEFKGNCVLKETSINIYLHTATHVLVSLW